MKNSKRRNQKEGEGGDLGEGIASLVVHVLSFYKNERRIRVTRINARNVSSTKQSIRYTFRAFETFLLLLLLLLLLFTKQKKEGGTKENQFLRKINLSIGSTMSAMMERNQNVQQNAQQGQQTVQDVFVKEKIMPHCVRIDELSVRCDDIGLDLLVGERFRLCRHRNF